MNSSFVPYLPQDADVVTELTKNYTYIIARSRTLCFPWQLTQPYTQLVIDAANTTPWESAFVPGLTVWPSVEAVGPSMTASPYPTQAHINIQPNGTKWLFYIPPYPLYEVDEPNIVKQIKPNTRYWINIKNLQNKDSNFFIRFTYQGLGTTLVV
jgi:hypothetical protein